MHARAVSFPLCSCLLSAVGRLWGLSGYQRCLFGCVQTFCCDKYPNTPNWGKPHFEHDGVDGKFSRTSLCWLLPGWIQIQEITVIQKTKKGFLQRPCGPLPPRSDCLLCLWGLETACYLFEQVWMDPQEILMWAAGVSCHNQCSGTQPLLLSHDYPAYECRKHTSAATWSHQAYFKGTESSIFRHPDPVIYFRCEHTAGCCVYEFSEGPCSTEVTIQYPFWVGSF